MHRIVGLDVSGDAVRLVTLESGFRGFAVQDARTAPLEGEGPPAERLGRALAQLALQPPLGPDDAVAAALPGSRVASHLVTLPFTDSRRIEQVLPAEVESAIPFEMDEVVWDYTVLAQANGRTEILVAVVRKDVLREAIAQLALVGIEPRVITFGPLALSALGEKGLIAEAGASAEPGAPVVSIALLEAGPDRADFCLLDGGQPSLGRSLGTASGALWTAARDDAAALQKLLAPLIRDLKISLRARGARGGAPQRVFLTGAIAGLPGAAERISAELLLPVEPLSLAASAPLAPGPDTALALGLALRAQQPRGRINFRKGEFAFTKGLSQVRGQLGKLAIAASILLVLALGLGVSRVSSLSNQAKGYDEALCSATKKILGTCYTDYRQALGALAGSKSKAAGIPRVSASEILAELMAQFPDDQVPSLEDVDLTTTTLRIKGVAESFGKVDEIITRLKKDKCFGEIKSPRVEKQRDGQKVNYGFDFAYLCSGEQSGGA